MKIGIDCRMYGLKHAGIGRYVQNLVENLMMIDKKNNFILFVRDEPQEIKNLKFKIVTCDIQHYSLKEQILFPFLLYKEKLDLVHFPHFNVPVFYFKKYIVTIHDLIKHTSRGMETTTRFPLTYWFKYWGYKMVFWLAVKRAAKILVPSEFVKNELINQYKLDVGKIVVTYEGVEEKLKMQPGSRRTNLKILEKYQIASPFLLYVGSVYPHKNIERLIKAVKILASSYHLLVTLIIVCSRSVFWERLAKKIRKVKAEEYIRSVGFVPDEELAVLYQKSAAFVFPTLSEGFGLPGLEAMAFGTPVVCSDIPVLREVYGKAAIFFNPLDEKDMAEKIFRVLSEKKLREQIKALGEKQETKYSWSKMAKKTLNEYNKV